MDDYLTTLPDKLWHEKKVCDKVFHVKESRTTAKSRPSLVVTSR